MKCKIFSNERAFSLAEVMVAAGLLGVVALGSMQIFQQINRANSRGKNINDLIGFNSAFERYVYGPKICDEVRNKTFSTSYANASFTQWSYGGQSSISSGSKLGSIEITSFKAKIDLSSSLPSISVSGETLKKTMLQLEVGVKAGKKNNNYYYNIPVLSTGAGLVKYCKEIKNAVEICNALLGEFDTTSGRCKHSNACQVRGTYITVTCSPSHHGCHSAYGSSTVNPLTGGSNCPSGSLASETAAVEWNHNVDCGKKCTDTVINTAKWFTCLECP